MSKEFYEMSLEELNDECLMQSQFIEKCLMCDKNASIVDMALGLRFCSRKCYNKFYNRLNEAVKEEE